MITTESVAGSLRPTGIGVIGDSDRKQVEEALKNSCHRLRALSNRLRSVREEEATRIAREIHDELGQKLTGLKMDLRRAERKLEELESSPGTLVRVRIARTGVTAQGQDLYDSSPQR